MLEQPKPCVHLLSHINYMFLHYVYSIHIFDNYQQQAEVREYVILLKQS